MPESGGENEKKCPRRVCTKDVEEELEGENEKKHPGYVYTRNVEVVLAVFTLRMCERLNFMTF